MSKGHTPEPWNVIVKNVYVQIVSGKRGVTEVFGLWSHEQGAGTHEQDKRNANRIVVCVNAMAGIEDPAAFMEVVKKLELDQYQNLSTAVREMREAQKRYFQTRSKEWLERSKQLEQQIDKLLSNQTTLGL